MTDISKIGVTPGVVVSSVQGKSIQPYPFNDPTFDEAIKLITDGNKLKNQGKKEEAVRAFQEAQCQLEEVLKKDYTKLIPIIFPLTRENREKLEESRRKAQATQIAAGTNIERCKEWIQSLQEVQPLNHVVATVLENLQDIQAHILIDVFGGDGLRDDVYREYVDIAINELGVKEPVEKQSLLQLAKSIVAAREEYNIVATPDNILFLEQHKISPDSIYAGKTLSEWKDNLVKKLSEPSSIPVESKAVIQNVVPEIDPNRAVVEALIAIQQEELVPVAFSEQGKEPSVVQPQVGNGGQVPPEEPPVNNGNDNLPLPDDKQPIARQYRPFGDEVSKLLDEIRPTVKGALQQLSPLSVISEAEAVVEISSHSNLDDDSQKLIKALLSDKVINTLPEVRALALLASRTDLSEAARDLEYNRFDFDKGVFNAIFPRFDNDKNTLAACQTLSNYLKYGKLNNFDEWYKHAIVEERKQLHIKVLPQKISDGEIPLGDVSTNELQRLSLQLINHSCLQGVISNSESQLLYELILDYNSFDREFLSLDDNDRKLIESRIENIVLRLERNYLNLSTKTKSHLLEFDKPAVRTDVKPSEGIKNLIHWLDLDNAYFQNYLDSKYPKPKIVTAGIKSNEGLSSPSGAIKYSTALGAPVSFQYITIDNWKDVLSTSFSNGNTPARRFLQAYFDLLLIDKKLPTVKILSNKLGISAQDFEKQKQLIDALFQRDEYGSLPIFPKDTARLGNVYFALKNIQDKVTPDEYLEKLYEEYNKLYKDKLTKVELCEIFQKDFSQLVALDPSIDESVNYYLKLLAQEFRDKEEIKTNAITDANKWLPDSDDLTIASLEISSSMFCTEDSLINMVVSPEDFLTNVKSVLSKVMFNGDESDIVEIKYERLLDSLQKANGISEKNLQLAWIHRNISNNAGRVNPDRLQEEVNKYLSITLGKDELLQELNKLNTFCADYPDKETAIQFLISDLTRVVIGVDAPHVKKLVDAVAGRLVSSGTSLRINDIEQEFNQLPSGERRKLYASYTAVCSGTFKVCIRYDDGNTEDKNISRDEYDKLISELPVK